MNLIARVESSEAIGQTGGVTEEVPNPNGLGNWHGHRCIGRSSGVHTSIGKGRDVPLNRIGQLKPALFKEGHECDRGDWLGHGVNPKEGVLFDRQSRRHVTVSAFGNVNNLTFACDRHEVTRNLSVSNVAIEVGVDSIETLWVKAKVGRVSGNSNRHGGHR